jgi:hypothetical protein
VVCKCHTNHTHIVGSKCHTHALPLSVAREVGAAPEQSQSPNHNACNCGVQVYAPDYPDVPPREVFVTIRDCIAGETRTDVGCTRCPTNQYSFQAGPNCTLCNPNAICDGGAVFAPKKGYWHSAFNSSNVQPCPNRKACQGERAPLVACQASQNCSRGLEYQTLQCSSGYGGNLCGSCRKEQGYGLGAYLRCSKCMSRGASVAVLLLMAIACCALVLYVAWRSLMEASRRLAVGTSLPGVLVGDGPPGETTAGPGGSDDEAIASAAAGNNKKLELSDVFKVLIVHLQYLSIIGNLLVDWPSVLRVMIDVTRLVFVASSSQIVSWDCLGGIGNGAMMAMSIIVPLIIVVLACAAMALLYRRQGGFVAGPSAALAKSTTAGSSASPVSSGELMDCLVATLLVGLFLFYSVLVSSSLSAFACVGVDSDSFWIKDMAVQCWSRQHLQSSLFIGVVGVLVFCILVPALTIWWLARNGSRLDDIGFQRRYGFLYRLYRPSFRFWEGVVCLQTLSLVCIDMFGRRHGAFYQLVLLAVVLVLNYSLVAVLRPFRCRPLQWLYAAGTVSLLLTCFGVQSLLKGYTLDAAPESDGVQNAVVVVVMVGNVAFVAVCVYLMAHAVAGMAKQSLQVISAKLQGSSLRAGQAKLKLPMQWWGSGKKGGRKSEDGGGVGIGGEVGGSVGGGQ